MADVVLIPGWCCDRSVVDPFATHLEADGHRVLSIDLPGHGSTAEAGDVTIEAYARHVLDTAAAWGLDAPLLVGHSMGGLVALAALSGEGQPGAADEVDAAGAGGAIGAAWAGGPARAVLLDPAPIASERAAALWRTAAESVATDHDGSWRRQMLQSLFLPTDTVMRDQIEATMSAFPTDLAAAEARAMAEFDGVQALGRLDRPLLIIHAQRAERGLRNHLSDPTLLTTGQTAAVGHFHHLEAPDQILPMLRRWLTVS